MTESVNHEVKTMKTKNNTQKTVLLIAGLVIVVAVIVALAAGGKDTKTNSAKTNSAKTSTAISNSRVAYGVQEACSILTSDVAKKVAGNDASLQKPQVPDAKSGSFNGSFCSYNGSKGTVSLFVHSPLDQSGASANDKQFATGRPKNSDDVKGYGDAAYWDKQYYQLNILKNHTWYVLSAGSSTAYKSRTLDQAKQFADLITNSF